MAHQLIMQFFATKALASAESKRRPQREAAIPTVPLLWIPL
jgi:hypothetical protein